MVKAICIDAKNFPLDLPKEALIVEGQIYTIRKIFKHWTQDCILGVELDEIDINKLTNGKYVSYKIIRFAFDEKDLLALRDLMLQERTLVDENVDNLILEEVEVLKNW